MKNINIDVVDFTAISMISYAQEVKSAEDLEKLLKIRTDVMKLSESAKIDISKKLSNLLTEINFGYIGKKDFETVELLFMIANNKQNISNTMAKDIQKNSINYNFKSKNNFKYVDDAYNHFLDGLTKINNYLYDRNIEQISKNVYETQLDNFNADFLTAKNKAKQKSRPKI